MLRTNGEFLPVVRPNDKSGQGWADYRAGRPYDPAYDGWDQIDQRNYERGRLRAAGAHLVYRRSRRASLGHHRQDQRPAADTASGGQAPPAAAAFHGLDARRRQ